MTLINDLNILPKENAKDISDWFAKATTERISECGADELVAIMGSVIDLKIYNNLFVTDWFDACKNKVDELSPTQLLFILRSSNILKHQLNIDSINVFISKLSTNIAMLSTDECSEMMLLLSKFEYQESALMDSLSNKIIERRRIDRVDISSIIDMLHATAKLDYYNPRFITYLSENIERGKNILNQRSLVNAAFYLTMIKVNNADETLNELITSILRRIDYSKITAIEEKQQLLQIKAARLSMPTDINVFVRWEQEVKDYVQNNLTISSTQRKVSEKLNNRFYRFCKITDEVWEPKMVASIDIMIEYLTTEAKVLLQVDGPNHWPWNIRSLLNAENISYIQPNATTKFNTAIARLNGLELLRINYFQAGGREYLENVDTRLAVINHSLESKRIESVIPASAVQSEVKIDPKPGKKTKKKLSKAANSKKASEEDDFLDSIIAENKAKTPIQLLQESYRARNYIEAIEAAINAGNYGHIKLFIEDCKNKISPEEFFHLIRDPHSVSKGKKEVSSSFIDICLNKLISHNPSPENVMNIASLLIRNGAEIDKETANPKSIINAYFYALKKEDHINVFKSCLDAIPESDNKTKLKEFTFIKLPSFANIKAMDYLLEEGVNYNACHPKQIEEVMYAAVTGKYHFGREFTEKESFVDGLKTALYRDASNNLSYIFQRYAMERVSHEPPYDEIGSGKGLTALHSVAYQGDVRMAQVLLNKGASLNTINSSGGTPLSASIQYRHPELANLFLKYNPNIDLLDLGKQSNIFNASLFGYESLVKKLLEISTNNIDVADLKNKVTPLIVALSNGYNDVARLLIEFGADLGFKNIEGTSAVSVTFSNNNLDLCKDIIIANASVDLFKRDVSPEDLQANHNLKNYMNEFERDPVEFITNANTSDAIKLRGLKNLLNRFPDMKEKINQERELIVMHKEDVSGQHVSRLLKNRESSHQLKKGFYL